MQSVKDNYMQNIHVYLNSHELMLSVSKNSSLLRSEVAKSVALWGLDSADIQSLLGEIL